MSKAKIITIPKDKTWIIEDTTHDNCPCANVKLFIPYDMNREIYEVYRHGKKLGTEISVFAQIEDGIMVDIYVPEQENSAASVEYLEIIPLEWNCLIHSHPDSMKTFSGQDRETLFVNRDYCLLICDGKYTDGIARANTDCGKKIYATIELTEELNPILDKIKKKEYKVAKASKVYEYKGAINNVESRVTEEDEEYIKTWGGMSGTDFKTISEMTDAEYHIWEEETFGKK